MKTIVLDISYNGEPFSGFAKQPGQLTVQGNIEKALSKIFEEDIQSVCAGRTDAGVHAQHQFVSFEIEDSILDKKNICSENIASRLSKYMHEDIYILNAEIKDCKFSARFDAKMRHYSYFICNQKQAPLFMMDFSWHIEKPLDIDSMRKASTHLIGEHDFKSFCVAASAKNKPTNRNISKIEFVEHEILGEHIIELQVSGNAFLHSMVRTIVGTLIKVGLKNKNPNWIKEVIDAKDRQAAGECAPACGLVLMNVDY